MSLNFYRLMTISSGRGGRQSIVMKRELLIIFLLALSFIFFLNFKGKKKVVLAPASVEDRKERIQDKVSQEMTLIEASQNLHEKQEQARQSLDLSSQSKDSKSRPGAQPLSLDSAPDANELNAFNDLNRNQKEIDYNKPSHVIQNQLTEKYELMKAQAEFNESYTKQFIENAKAHGYEVKLNEKNEVVSVTAIRNPSSTQQNQKFKVNDVNNSPEGFIPGQSNGMAPAK